jgi:hypothetical protein
MSPSARIGLAWYFHLPAVSSDIEVRDHVRGSLEPILRLHHELDLPVLLAPTGSFLRHCERSQPEMLLELRAEIEVGRVTLGGTYLFETDPLSVPWTSLIAHVGRDVELKRRLLGVEPAWLLLPNFVWRPGLERILRRFGIRGAILDSRQLAASSAARSWRWEADADGAVSTSAVECPTEPWEHRRLRTLTDGAGATELRLAFRDWPLMRSLTFGNDGAIHRRHPEREIETVMRDADVGLGSSGLAILADDGDRVRGTSLAGYRALLERIHQPIDWGQLIDEGSSMPPLRELGVYSPPGIDALLRRSDDARFYWSLLEELRSFPWTVAEREQQLALDDVFYPFWPGVGRRRWYVDRVLEWIELGSERNSLLDTDAPPPSLGEPLLNGHREGPRFD